MKHQHGRTSQAENVREAAPVLEFNLKKTIHSPQILSHKL